MSAFGYRKPPDLPATIPVFPLDGALLLPRGVLPLNIFEPRYLNMIDDALAGDRLVGMSQTRGDDDPPRLQDVGCVGRLTSFSETDDGRYVIALTGVCRFRVVEELPTVTPYRQIRADYDAFARDLIADQSDEQDFDRAELLDVLKQYLDANGLNAEWSAIENAPPEMLVNSLAMICPFEPPEKQALLEAQTVDARRDTLVALMRMGALTSGGGPGEIQ